MNMKKTWKWLHLSVLIVLGCLSFFSACSSSEDSEIVKNEYYDAIENIYPLYKQIANKTNGSSLSFESFKNVMKHAVPSIETTLKKYKKTDWAEKTSYIVVADLLNNYVEAQGFWQDQKGLHLVQGRFARGREMIKELEVAFENETGRKLTKD